MSIKDTIEDMRKIANIRGGYCLSTLYVDNRTPLEWQCEFHHKWFAKPANIKGSRNKRGTWCPTCGKAKAVKSRRKTIDDMHQLAAKKNGFFCSSKYNNSSTKYLWKCENKEHDKFIMGANQVQQGQWCPECSGNSKPTIIKLNKLAQERSSNENARCLSTNYINGSSLLEWSCGVDNHPSFKKTYIAVKHEGTWCSLCKKRSTKYNLEFLKKFAEQCGASLIEGQDYYNTKQKMNWRCVDGHLVSRSLDQIFSSRSLCSECSRLFGIREQLIRVLFEFMFSTEFKRIRNLVWLKNSNRKKMELDGYNSDLSLAFEHNGQQHYEIDGFFIKNTKQLQRRIDDDNEKRRLCKENGVLLIVISYEIPIKDIQGYIFKELKKHGMKPKIDVMIEPGLIIKSKLGELKKAAEKLDGTLLSATYKGSNEKLEWKCSNIDHGIFEATPSSVLSGKWCRKCASAKQVDLNKASSDQVQNWAIACNGKLLLEHNDYEKKFSLYETAKFLCLLCNKITTRTINKVKNGSLCLCKTNKKRINILSIQEKLAGFPIMINGELTIEGGKTNIQLKCTDCLNTWSVKASHIMNGNTSCPYCKRKNSKITLEKCNLLASKIGFSLLNNNVINGNEVLTWECLNCKKTYSLSYRKMRNKRVCANCGQNKKLLHLAGSTTPKSNLP